MQALLLRVTGTRNGALRAVMKIERFFICGESHVGHLPGGEFPDCREGLVDQWVQAMDPAIRFGLADPKQRALYGL